MNGLTIIYLPSIKNNVDIYLFGYSQMLLECKKGINKYSLKFSLNIILEISAFKFIRKNE